MAGNKAHYLDLKASLIPDFEMKTNKIVDYMKPVHLP